MIYIVNTDAPGFIGALGTTLGEAGINIATFNLGRRKAGGEAVALVAVDDRSRRRSPNSFAISRACWRSCRSTSNFDRVRRPIRTAERCARIQAFGRYTWQYPLKHYLKGYASVGLTLGFVLALLRPAPVVRLG